VGHDLGELRFLWQSLKIGMAFLDIGAHHGIYSIVTARRMGARGTVGAVTARISTLVPTSSTKQNAVGARRTVGAWLEHLHSSIFPSHVGRYSSGRIAVPAESGPRS
jgi:hypothetical protein